MPASPTATSAQRAIHARRTRLRRGAPAEKTRSSGDGEGKLEESEGVAGLVSFNRFGVLRPKEPAPGGQEELDLASRPERPMALPIQTDILPGDQTSSSEKTKDKSLASTSPAIPNPKRPSIQRLAPHTLAKSTRGESNPQPSPPAAASILATSPQAQPSPLVLQVDRSVRSSRPPSASARISPDFDTAAPHSSLLAPHPPPNLPLPPVPQDPLPSPSLASLPIHPALDFKAITSPRVSGPKSPQFAPPTPTSCNIFPNDDPLRHVVGTTSGKIFSIAAEIAAVNAKSATKPVGSFLVPANKRGEVREKSDRKRSGRRSGEYVYSPRKVEDKSEEDGEEGEEWLGKEEGFWKQPCEDGNVVKTRGQNTEGGRR